MECTDENGKQAEYKLKLKKENEKKEKKEKKENVQDDVQTLASWQLLGSKSDQLWLLVSSIPVLRVTKEQ
jgi:hypothetical protein